MIPNNYVCPICGELYWMLCEHTEWDIICHLQAIVDRTIKITPPDPIQGDWTGGDVAPKG